MYVQSWSKHQRIYLDNFVHWRVRHLKDVGEQLFSNDVYNIFVVKGTFTCWEKIAIRRKENYSISHDTSFIVKRYGLQ